MENRGRKRWLGLCGLLLATVGVIGLGAWTYFTSIPPRIVLNGAAAEKVALHSVYTDKGAKAAGFGKNKVEIETVGHVDTERRGTYTLEYRLHYRGQTVTAKRQVTVADVTPPEIQLQGEAVVTVSKKNLFVDPGVTATDNLDGDLSSSVTVTEQRKEENVYTLVYSVADSDGNRAQATREVRVQDIVKPQITLNGDSQMVIVQGDKYYDSGATALDDADGDLSANITVSGGVDTARLGTHTITYTVQDSSGNTATAERVVTVISKTAAEANRIFLTFDDGPSKTVTTRILDILKKNNVKATFFILDYSEDKKPILQRMIDEGHTIGIHGYTHDFSKVYASDAAFMENINKLNDKLYRDFGYRTNLIRFPGGSSNTVSRKYSKGIMTRLSKLVPASGYIYYDWNISGNDAVSGVSSKSYIVSSVTGGLRHGRNNIVLLHDAAAKTTTADSLQQIIDYGKTHGYVFQPLTDAVPPTQHKVQN